jgi:hypothetical protein
MIDSSLILSVFDAVLVGSDEAAGHAQFRAGGLEYGMSLSSPLHWTLGTIGVLRFNDEGICICFSAYPDQRLRRAPGRDNPRQRRWGWAIEDHTFSVRAGLIPGLVGAVVSNECVPLEVLIPPEFTHLCQDHDLEPLDVLRAFIADLCQITDSRRCPREDGYCSSGANERFLAREYFRRAHRSLRLSSAWRAASGLR